MAAIITAGEAVARIAYLSSDAIVSVQPALSSDSEFSQFLRKYAENDATSLVCKQTPEVLPVRHNADPLLDVYSRVREGKVTTVTTSSDVLIKSVPHLYKLAQYPVVIHVSLQPTGFPDYGDITSIRNSGFTFIQSHTLQEAQDLALTAHALAIRSGRGVIHFYDAANSKSDQPIKNESRELVAEVLNLDIARSFQDVKSEETNIYVDDSVSQRAPHAAAPAKSEEKAAAASPVINGVNGVASPQAASATSSSGSERNGSSSGASVAESTTTVDSQPKPLSS